MNTKQTVFIVDDDEGVRDGLSLLLATVGQPCELYESACDFLDAYDPSRHGCLVLDIRMPRMPGLDLQRRLIDMKARLPIIFITGHGDVPMAVEAMRRGAVDFIRKPFREHDLLDRINEALNLDDDIQKKQASRQQLADKLEALSEREWQVFERVAEGEMNKVISETREEMSQYAPRYLTLKIHPDKIRDVIGKGGAVIRTITEETVATVDIENDGTVRIASVEGASGRVEQRARRIGTPRITAVQLDDLDLDRPGRRAVAVR